MKNFLFMEKKMHIQIMKIYKDSFKDVRSHAMDWARVISGPVLLWVIGLMIVGATIGSNFTAEPSVLMASVSSILALALFYILAIVGSISVIINGYRYAVLRADGDRWFTLNLNMRFVKLILFWLLVGLLISIYGSIAVGIVIGLHALFENIALDVIVGGLLGLYGLFLYLRISLYQVAISVDKSEPLKTSWALMKGNIWRLLGLIILVMLTVAIISTVGIVVLGLITSLLYLGGETLVLFSLVLWVPFGILIMLLNWAVTTKAVGLVYKDLSKKK